MRPPAPAAGASRAARGAPAATTANSGCRDGSREGFLSLTDFPDIGGTPSVGGGFTYVPASTMAGILCAAGWHWCTASEIKELPASPAPTPSTAGSCAWLDSQKASCKAVFEHLDGACAGATDLSSPTSGLGGGTSSGGCGEGWRLAAALDRWGSRSVTDTEDLTCYPHTQPACGYAGGTIGTRSCWIACCR